MNKKWDRRRSISGRELDRSMRVGRRLAGAGLPADTDCRLPQVVLTCGRYVRVEHHSGLLQMTGELVRVYSALGIIRIEGKDLVAADMDDDVILLDGAVKSVSFEQFCQMQGKIQ